MTNIGKFIAITVVFTLVVFAQTQIATITSDSPFQLRGANVTPGQGVPSWPLMPGDTILAGQTPLTVTFPDGSTIILSPGSSAKVDLAGQTPVFQLENGSVHYSLKSVSAVKLMEMSRSVTPKGIVGDLQLGVSPAPAGWWTTGHTVAVVAAAGAAAGLGVGISKSRGNGPPVSPSVCNNGNGNGNGQPPCNP